MRFLETLLIVLVAIYVAQLVLAALLLALLIMFLFCLYKRPAEALLLIAAVGLVAALHSPAGFALLAALAFAIGIYALGRWVVARRRPRRSRPVALLPKP